MLAFTVGYESGRMNVRPGISFSTDDRGLRKVFFGQCGCRYVEKPRCNMCYGGRMAYVTLGYNSLTPKIVVRKEDGQEVGGLLIDGFHSGIIIERKSVYIIKNTRQATASQGCLVLLNTHLANDLMGSKGEWEIVTGDPRCLAHGFGEFAFHGEHKTCAKTGLFIIRRGDVLRVKPQGRIGNRYDFFVSVDDPKAVQPVVSPAIKSA